MVFNQPIPPEIVGLRIIAHTNSTPPCPCKQRYLLIEAKRGALDGSDEPINPHPSEFYPWENSAMAKKEVLENGNLWINSSVWVIRRYS